MGLVKTFQLIVSSISEPWNTWKFYQVSIWPYLTHFGKPKTLIKWGCFAWLFLLSIFSASPLSYVLHITFEDTESVSVNTLHTTVYHITPYYIRIEQTLLTMQSKKNMLILFLLEKNMFCLSSRGHRETRVTLPTWSRRNLGFLSIQCGKGVACHASNIMSCFSLRIGRVPSTHWCFKVSLKKVVL